MNVMSSAYRLAHRSAVIAALCAVSILLPQVLHADDLKDGKVALQAGRNEEAIKAFEKAAQQGLAAGRAGVGQVWLRRRQYDKAMEAFQLAQKMDGMLAMAYYGQGEVLRRQDRCSDAIKLFEKANELDRKFPEAKLSLGECQIQSKQFEQGVATLSDGLKWGPKWRPRFLVALGNSEESRDSLRDAGIYFTKAREEAPSDPEVRKALGNFYMGRGTWPLAILELEAALALDTSDVEIHFALGKALFYSERYSDALQAYRHVTARDPDFAPAHLALGNLLYLAGAKDPRRYVEAREPLETYTKIEPGDAKGWSLLGRTYYFLRMRDEAGAALVRAESMGDKNKEMFTVLGRWHADKRDWPNALVAFGKGEPGTKEALLIGQMYVFQNQLDRADSVYRSVLDKDSTAGDARFALHEMGKLRFRRQDYPGAIGLLERRIALDPSNGEAYYYVGLSQKELKRYAESLAALQRAAELDSLKADRFFWLGVLHDQQKSIEDAKRAFTRAVALDDTSKLAGKSHRQLGFYLLLEKDWVGAIQHLERGVALDAQDIQAWVWLGQGYQNAGNRNKAMEAYKRALALDPSQPEATKGVKALSGGPTSAKGG